MRQLLVALIIVLAGCATPAVGDPALDLTEFAIRESGAWSPGTVTVKTENRGEFGHTVVVTDAEGAVVAASEVIDPGESTEVELELAPGRYDFTCRIVVQTSTGTIVDHFERGMVTSVEISS